MKNVACFFSKQRMLRPSSQHGHLQQCTLRGLRMDGEKQDIGPR